MKILYVLLALTVIKCIVIYKVFHSLPVVELKRRARTGDKRATALHKVAAYGRSFDVLLWLLGTAAAVTLVIWSARTNWWLAVVVIVIIAWLLVFVRVSANGWMGRVAAFAAPAYAGLLSLLDPLLRLLAHLFPSNISLHTGLYEKRDLLEMLGNQNKQVDNRIPESDLKIAYGALTFGDKTVRQIMTPRKKVKMVGYNDAIGPMLMDELHSSGFSRFPVVKDSVKVASPKVVGTLYLNNLIGYDGNGKVKDLAKSEVYFINEDVTVHQALAAFLKTHHHLLIVINSFEEMVGVLTLEDVLEQILGKQIIDEFENYENLRPL
ncbi:CBS domain-containing protein, partial [Candidatus Saccharibacteria bacterium]|nr:CBS domain-containing protein [Candidatus Saccharibacteria bacterium]